MVSKLRHSCIRLFSYYVEGVFVKLLLLLEVLQAPRDQDHVTLAMGGVILQPFVTRRASRELMSRMHFVRTARPGPAVLCRFLECC